MGPSIKLLVIFISLPCIAAAGKNFAVLVAGANTWPNYPAQSLVCHGYHTLSKLGIPDERLIVMMFDDIAYNPQNPKPGTIIDRYNGSDVYAGVPKDYKGDEITKDVFLAVLRGDKAAVKKLIGRDGKVIESGPDDNVFVYYIDHGSTRIVAFPNGHPPMHAMELINTLKQMHKDKKYKQLMIYLEACESGSMFKGILPTDINVYATTAANSTEYAWMIYCNDPTYHTCLSSEYTCNWQTDADNENMKTESIQTQFENTRDNTFKSHPKEFGDMTISKEVVATFFGATNKGSLGVGRQPPCGKKPSDSIPVPMVKIAMLRKRISRANAFSQERLMLERQLEAELKMMADTETLFLDIAKTVFNDKFPESKIPEIVFNKHYDEVRDNECYEDAVDILHAMCPPIHASFNPYSMDKMVSLLHACNSQSYKTVVHAVKSVVVKSQLCKSKIIKS